MFASEADSCLFNQFSVSGAEWLNQFALQQSGEVPQRHLFATMLRRHNPISILAPVQPLELY